MVRVSRGIADSSSFDSQSLRTEIQEKGSLQEGIAGPSTKDFERVERQVRHERLFIVQPILDLALMFTLPRIHSNRNFFALSCS